MFVDASVYCQSTQSWSQLRSNAGLGSLLLTLFQRLSLVENSVARACASALCGLPPGGLLSLRKTPESFYLATYTRCRKGLQQSQPLVRRRQRGRRGVAGQPIRK